MATATAMFPSIMNDGVSQQHGASNQHAYGHKEASNRRSRRVVFYKNGDKYFAGKLVTIAPNRYFSFRDLMNDLNRSVDLPYGVRRVYSPVSGREIYDIEDLVDGSSYVCASFEPFRPARYGDTLEKPWNGNLNSQRQEINGTNIQQHQNLPNIHQQNMNPQGYYLPKQYNIRTIPIVSNNNGFVISNSIKKSIGPNSNLAPLANRANGVTTNSEAWSKPRLITIIRATERPRKKITILLNRKALHSYEQFVCDISDAFGLPQWRNDKIRKLYTIRGKRVQGISDFFRETDMFVGVSGKEPLKSSLIQDLIHEIYPDNEEYAQSLYKEWESSRSKSRAKPRYSSMDHLANSNGTNSVVNNSGQNPGPEGDVTPEGNGRRNHYSVEFDENGRRKRKKKLAETDVLLEMETQRQRERLKLLEIERKKREQAIKQANEKENKLNYVTAKRVNIITPTKDGGSGGGGSGNNTNLNDSVEKKPKRKPKFRKPNHEETPETNNNNNISNNSQKVSSNNLVVAEENPPSRNTNVKSKSPALPKIDNRNSQASPHHQSNTPAPQPQPQPQPQKQSDKQIAKPKPKEEPTTNKLRRQISSVAHVMEKYEFIKTLGDGNFAVVKQAKSKLNDHEYAIKIIDKSKMKGKENMIENEIYIMKSCNHPNIVKLYEEFETKDEVYLVTDLVKGGDLFDAISGSVKFNERDSACMVQDLCEALFYLHSKNIVHRDLKPENLLVMRKKDDRITIKLADFGLAMEVKQPIYTVCGTPTYVAPEILSEIGYGLEVDMWACGVITYILLCGFPPFRSIDRNQEELFQYIQAGEFEYLMPYWEGISESSKDLINHLLVVDMKKRWKAEDVLSHPWIVTQGNSKPLPPNFDEYRKELLADLRAKAKIYAAEPFAPK